MVATRLERYAVGALESSVLPLAPQETQATALAPGGLIGALARRAPVGAVACITSYNFPVVNMVGKLGPALATGNTVVVRPAGQDPLAVIELVKILDEVGFPPGVVNVITGSSPVSGQALVESPDIDMVSFTGSTAVGMQIGEAAGRGLEAPAARARRQGRGDRVRGRRPQVHDRHDRLGVDVPLRADLHRADPGDRAPLGLRPGRRRPLQDGGGAQGRRPVGEGHGHRPAHHRGPPQPGRGLHPVGRGTRAARSWPAAVGPGTSRRAGSSSRP